MVIDKNPFTPYKHQEERDQEKSKVITIRLNREELADLEILGKLIKQEKLGTVIKQVMSIGVIVLQQPQTALIVSTLFKNDTNNKRQGIITVNPKFKQL